jgi:hypothetical protein
MFGLFFFSPMTDDGYTFPTWMAEMVVRANLRRMCSTALAPTVDSQHHLDLTGKSKSGVYSIISK